MNSTTRHPELEGLGPLIHVDEPSELEEWIGKTVYRKRSPEPHPEYSIKVNGEYVHRATTWDDDNDVVFLDHPQTWTIGHLQRDHAGTTILRGYQNERDFGHPCHPEDLIEVK